MEMVGLGFDGEIRRRTCRRWRKVLNFSSYVKFLIFSESTMMNQHGRVGGGVSDFRTG